MHEVFLLVQANIPAISKATGFTEEAFENLLLNDQQQGLVTKIVVLQPQPLIEEALRKSAAKWRHLVRGGMCPTCEYGPSRETKNLVCQTCGRDYGNE